MSNISRITKAVLATIAVVTVAVGVPVVLVVTARWPLPTKMPNWDNVYWAIRQGNVPAEVVVKALACVVWLAWAQVMWALLWTLCVNVPRLLGGRPEVPVPLTAAPVSRLARRMVSAVMLFTAVASTPAATAAAPALASLTQTGSAPPDSGRVPATLVNDRADTTSSTAANPATWVVQDGDTLWDIAAECLGDGSRVDELIAANRYLSASRPLRPGQVIELPAGAEPPAGRSPVTPLRPAMFASSEPPNNAAHQVGGERSDINGSSLLADHPTAGADRSAAEPINTIVVVNDETYTVREGDTLWQIVDEHYGSVDAELITALATTNHLRSPSLILPGQTLTLPSLEQLRPQGDAVSVDALPPVAEMTVHVVEVGDTLSALAARYLGDAGRHPEIFEANRDLIQPDGRRLSDPDLIVVGWRLTIPTDSAPPTRNPLPETVDHSGAPTTNPDPPTPTSPTTTDPPATSSTTATPPVTTQVSQSTPTTSAPAPPSTTPPPTAPPSTTSPDPAPSAAATPNTSPTETPSPTTGTTSDASTGPDSAVLLALAGAATALTTALAMRLRWLRKRRSTRTTRDPVPTTELERAVATAADEPLVRWAGQQLAAMTRQLDRRHIAGGPVAVELSEATGIELLWDAPQTAAPPTGWSAADGGWAWRCDYDPNAPIPANQYPAAIPALVTIGERDGRQLLVDLEAFGVLSLGGPPEHALALAASMAVELACGDDLADSYVTTVGVNIDPALAPRHRLQTTDLGAALAILDSAARSVTEVLPDNANTFRARVGETTPIEATVIVAGQLQPEQLTQLSTRAAPRGGLAVVTTSPVSHDPAAARIEIDADGTTARLEPLGISFRPASLRDAALTTIESTVAALAQLPTEHDPIEELSSFEPIGISTNGHRPHDSVVEPLRNLGLAPVPQTDGEHRPLRAASASHDGDAGAERLFEPAVESGPPAMIVRVLGVPRIDERPDLGRRELILAVLLACRNGTLAATAAQDALWGGRPVEAKTVWNFVASTRRALGDFDDGTPVMPAADRTRGTLRLDRRVRTDLAVLRAAVEAADDRSSSEALGVLVEALELIEGPPFDAAGYDWAHRDQDVAEAGRMIHRAVDALVELALDAGQIDVARDAILRGLRGLPGDEHLYRSRLRVEAAAGNHAGVVAAFEELCLYLEEFETQPSPVTTALYQELKRRPTPSTAT